jgi:hypothetical protein
MQRLEEILKGLISLGEQRNDTGVTQNMLNRSQDSMRPYDLPQSGDARLDALEATVCILAASQDRINMLPADWLYAVNSSSGLESSHSAGRQQAHFSQFTPKLFPFRSFRSVVDHLDPAPAQALICWRTYQELVDPHIKVLHCPSVEHLLQKASANRESLRKSETALLLAIYFASVTSMSPHDVERYFRYNKTETLSKYRAAAEHALMEANVLTSEDTTTLQAFVLFLSLHNFINEAKRAWAFTALAKRLNSDFADLMPFEQEMRRRLCWQLHHCDFRAVVDQGKSSSPLDSMPYAELPLHVFDADLFPDMLQLPPPRDCWTQISFALIMYHIDITAAAVELAACQQDKEALISDCETFIYSSYLRHCNGSLPSHWLAEHVAYVQINEMRLRHYTKMPNHLLSGNLQTVQEQLFHCAIDIVDTASRVKNEPQARKWLWSLSGYMQFAPLKFLLTELCRRRERRAFRMAWAHVEDAFCRWADDIKETKKGRQIQELIEHAREEKRRIDEMSVVMDSFQLNADHTTSLFGGDLGSPASPFSNLDFPTGFTELGLGSDVESISNTQHLSAEDVNSLFLLDPLAGGVLD